MGNVVSQPTLEFKPLYPLLGPPSTPVPPRHRDLREVETYERARWLCTLQSGCLGQPLYNDQDDALRTMQTTCRLHLTDFTPSTREGIFFEILEPICPSPCLQLGLIYSTEFTQTPRLYPLLSLAPLPPSADIASFMEIWIVPPAQSTCRRAAARGAARAGRGFVGLMSNTIISMKPIVTGE